jgi:hypothetical protein
VARELAAGRRIPAPSAISATSTATTPKETVSDETEAIPPMTPGATRPPP